MNGHIDLMIIIWQCDASRGKATVRLCRNHETCETARIQEVTGAYPVQVSHGRHYDPQGCEFCAGRAAGK